MENVPEKKIKMEKEFFINYKEKFKDIKDQVLVQGYNILEARKFALLLLNRLIIVYFIQKIEWIFNDKNHVVHYLNKYKESSEKNSFYDKWLTKLFFEGTVNGPFFEKRGIDKFKIDLPDALIFEIIEQFLEKYKFTVSEGTPPDSDVVINPAMLGKTYESLIAEEERGKSGIFYTPRIQVDLICRLAVLEFFLSNKYSTLPNEANPRERLITFIFTPLKNWSSEKKNEFLILKKALDNVKIVDPACGSGDFLVGMFHVLLELYQKLEVKIDIEFKENIVKNSLHGIDVKDWAVRIAKIRLWLILIENEIKMPKIMPFLPKLLFNLHSGDSLLRSTWESNYSGIALKDGFDIVITNPPYVRQEDIVDPSTNLEAYNQKTDSEKRKIKENYKKKLVSQVSNGFNLKISKKSDYYVYFFFKAIELAGETGVIALLSSNSWLDVQFGTHLREGLLKNAHVKTIIENLSMKAFESADINTIIIVLSKKKSNEQLSDKTRFISLYRAYEEVLKFNNLSEIFADIGEIKAENIQLFNANLNIKRVTDFRTLTIPERDLLDLGTKWGKFLKAPEIYFKILEKFKNVFVRLGDVATFTYGEKTGANDFFFLGKPGSPHKYFNSKYDETSGNLNLYLKNNKFLDLFKDFLVSNDEPIFSIEKEYWMHVLKNSNENTNDLFEYKREESNNMKWVPNYLIKSPKELNNVIVPPRELNKIYLIIPKEKSLLKEGIKNYIKWGESMKYHARPSCSRTPWHALNPSAYEDIICVELIHDRYFFANNKYKLLYDHTIYGFSFEHDSEINGAILNSTLFALFMEFEGRTTYGDGALGLMQYEYESLLTIKPDVVAQLGEMDRKFLKSYFNGEISPSIDSIFVEIGTTYPIEVKLENIKPSRREVDKIVFEKILKLSEEEQLEVYRSVINLVKRRLEKAKGMENRFH